MGSQEATFNGYVHSTRDALLIFEAVRRGALPKITRRLRDDERKMIKSGTIFVFDEVESSIKRWTDGMIWSPSRILNNFLVYREVEKKDPKPAPDQPAFSATHSGFALQGGFNGSGLGNSAQHSDVRSVPLTLMPNALDGDGQMMQFKQEHGGYHSLEGASGSSNQIYAGHDGFFGNQTQQHHSAHNQSHTQAAGMVGLIDDAASASAAKREAELDRTIVGSLTSSYPFVRDGLCKKTISMQVNGSTQHLISYYKIDDVHNQRLAIPSNLPEIASLHISPIFLNKSNFRYPPVVEIGPDGPRYVGESTDNVVRTSGHISSGTESYSSGSEARHDSMVRAASRSLSIYSPAMASDPPHVDLYSSARYPHQIGGDGMLPASATLPSASGSASYRVRRSSDAPRRRANSRYEPYQTNFGSGMVAAQLYSNVPVDHGAISPSGRRLFPGNSRGYGEAEPVHGSEQAQFAASRQDQSYFGYGQMNQAAAQNGTTHIGHLDQQYPATGQVGHQGDFQQSFQADNMIPIVPSQPPSRTHTGYSTGADFMHGRSDAPGIKQDASDPFHFSNRLTRGSWDSNQPTHSNSFMHNVQQPPATSQGLMAASVHSHSTFGGPVYGRNVGSPPQTSSSLDSRHSYMGTGVGHPTARIEELVDGVHPPTATGWEDTGHSSRPISRAEEGFVGDLDSAGVVRTGPLKGVPIHSGSNSPYPRSQLPSHHQQQSGNDVPVTENYGRSDEQQSFYQQQATHPPEDMGKVQLEHHDYDRHAQEGYASAQVYSSNEQPAAATYNSQGWSSDPIQEGNGTANPNQAYSSRPGTAQDPAYQHHQYRSDLGSTEAGDASATGDSGLERVMLTRPTQ